jgi:predicted permease
MPDVKRRVTDAFTGVFVDDDVLDELAQHAESTYAALRAGGEAESDALARIDELIAGWRADPRALARAEKRAPAVKPPPPARTWAGVWGDLRYAVRLLRAQPGAAAITILTIALGVGAVTSLFSVANGVLLRPLPWVSGEGVVRVIESRGGRQGRVPGTVMNGTYLAWSDSPDTIDTLASWTEGALTLRGAGEATRVTIAEVTPSLFDLVRVPPLRGRVFTPEEATEGNSHYVVLSAGTWERRFGAREDLIGGSIVMDGAAYTVLGVMPRRFVFPTAETEMWLPRWIAPVDGRNGVKRGQIFRALARLKPGVTPAQAAAEATARAAAAPDAGMAAVSLFGAREPIQITVVDANEAATAEVRPAIILLLIAAWLLFVTAVANVANMQLARAVARHRELTIRAALGAAASRLSRQLLIESAVVAAGGAGLGLAVTIALHRALPWLLPAGFPRAGDIAIDGRVLALTALLVPLTSVVAGLLPLMHARRVDLARALARGGLGSAGAGRGWLALARLAIVGSQVAITAVLVIGAVLLTRSFIARISADRGYDAGNVLTATVPFPGGWSYERRQQARTRILERLATRPGITHAAFSTGVPLISAGGFTSFNFASAVRNGGEVQAESIRRVVTPGYFGALGVRMAAGRPLTASDVEGTPTAVVVNRSFVQKFLDDIPAERAIGLSLGQAAVMGTVYAGDATIVGVSNDMRQDTVDAPDQPEMFVAMAQISQPSLGASSIVLIRTVDDPIAYLETLRSVVREEDPAIALDGLMTLEQRVSDSVSRPRVYAVLLGGFAAFALVIAATGLFGVLSYTVTQRWRELAVRSALGASRPRVVVAAVAHMGAAIAAGIAGGVLLSLWLSSQLTPFLYGVSSTDLASFFVAPVVLAATGVAACIIPARRVANTDPITVLREM